MATGRGARAGQLLLLVALLLLGIASMHTLGHPSESHAAPGHPSGAVTSLTAAGHGPPTGDAPRSAGDGRPAPADSGAALGADAAHSPAHGPPTPPASPAHGMDPAMVCLAVLGACGVALLVVAGRWLRRRGGRRRARARAAGRCPAPDPDPPPLGTLLAQLSVLRI